MPNPLYTMTSTNQPFSYSTVPLDDPHKRSIRILELLPSPNPTSLIQCHLHAVSLNSNPVYEAISYFWGARYFECSIICNGANMNITRSLHGALQRLRHPSQSRHVWADAICINQSSEAMAERISQVGMMRDIYASAEQVLIWLGEAENNSHQAIYIIRQLAKHRSKLEAIVRPSFWSTDQLESLGLKFSNGAIEREWAALQPFFDRPWFKRIWTVQEVAVAPKAVLFCEGEEIQWDEMVSGLEIGISSRVLTSKRALNPDTLDFFDPAHAAQLNYTQVLQKSPKYAGYNFDSLLSYLLWFRPREATNPLDKIFALLGLVDKRDQIAASIIPDYELTPEALYTSVAIQLLQGTKTLDVLSTPRNPASQSLPSLPSWVPNWSDSSIPTMSLLGQSRFAYSATGSSQASVQISPDNKILQLKGHLIDSISSLAPVLQKSSAFYTPPMTSWRDTIRDFSTTLDKLSENQKVLMEWEALAKSISVYPTGEPINEVFQATLKAGLPRGYNMKGFYEDWRGNSLPGNLPKAVDSTKHPRLFKGAVFLQVFQDAFAGGGGDGSADGVERGRGRGQEFPTMAYGRRLGRATGGYLALLPGDTKVGDVVGLCEGGKTPLVLRSRGDGLFELVGDCYVHGVMKGEMFRSGEMVVLKIV